MKSRYLDVWPDKRRKSETTESSSRSMLLERLVLNNDDDSREENETESLLLAYASLRTEDIELLSEILHSRGITEHIDDYISDTGCTLLHIASKNGFYASIDMLLKSSADPLVMETKGGNIPLHLAAIGGHAQSLKLLLTCSNPNMKNMSSGKVALHYAAEYGYEECVCELLRNNSSNPLNINAQDDHGHTALHLACIDGSLAVVKLLLNAGVDASLKDCDGRTAMDIASSMPARDDIVRELAISTEIVKPSLFDGLAVKASMNKESLFEGLTVQTFPVQRQSVSLPSSDSPRSRATSHSAPPGRWVVIQSGKFLLDRRNKQVIVHRDRNSAVRWGHHWRWNQADEKISQDITATDKILSPSKLVRKLSLISDKVSDKLNSLTLLKRKSVCEESSDHALPVTSTDDLSDLYVAEIDASAWDGFVKTFSFFLMEMAGEDPLLDEYISKHISSAPKKNSRRPSFEGNNMRFFHGLVSKPTEESLLKKDIECLRDEIEAIEAAIECANNELSLLKSDPVSYKKRVLASLPTVLKSSKALGRQHTESRPPLDANEFSLMLEGNTPLAKDVQRNTDDCSVSRSASLKLFAPLDANEFSSMLESGGSRNSTGDISEPPISAKSTGEKILIAHSRDASKANDTQQDGRIDKGVEELRDKCAENEGCKCSFEPRDCSSVANIELIQPQQNEAGYIPESQAGVSNQHLSSGNYAESEKGIGNSFIIDTSDTNRGDADDAAKCVEIESEVGEIDVSTHSSALADGEDVMDPSSSLIDKECTCHSAPLSATTVSELMDSSFDVNSTGVGQSESLSNEDAANYSVPESSDHPISRNSDGSCSDMCEIYVHSIQNVEEVAASKVEREITVLSVGEDSDKFKADNESVVTLTEPSTET